MVIAVNPSASEADCVIPELEGKEIIFRIGEVSGNVHMGGGSFAVFG